MLEPWKFIHDYVLSNARVEDDSCQASSHTFWRGDGSFAVSANMSNGCEHPKTFKFKLNKDALQTIRSTYRTEMYGDQFQGCEPDEEDPKFMWCMLRLTPEQPDGGYLTGTNADKGYDDYEWI